MSVRKLIFLLLFSGNCFLHAQNLVPNPSFEGYKVCPDGGVQSSKTGKWTQGPSSWFSPSPGTFPWYFNTCSIKYFGVPKNLMGSQEARTGKAYIHLILFFDQSSNYLICPRTYISSELDSVLVKDQLYCIKFFVSLEENSDLECSNIGMYLSEKSLSVQEWKAILSYSPQIINDGNFISNDSDWVEVSGIYKAMGGEKYITIGNFVPNEKGGGKLRKGKTLSRVMDSPSVASYYIDDVSVVHITNEFDCISESKPLPLKNIFFNTGKSKLLPTSFPELDKLVTSLKQNLNTVEVSGHTDNSGKETENLKLSAARAKAVADYLISKGIKKERVKFKGYGSSKPIAKNDTEEGKQQNRRVEIEFIK